MGVRVRSILAVFLASGVLSACAAPREAPSAEAAEPAEASTSEALGVRVPGPPHPPPTFEFCGGKADYASLTPLAPPSVRFDDCAAASMSSSIAIYFLIVNAQAQKLLADVNDCVSRVHAADTCTALFPKGNQPSECLEFENPVELPVDKTGFGGGPGETPHTCDLAEENAAADVATLLALRGACIDLLATARHRLQHRCGGGPAIAKRDTAADGLAADAALEAAKVTAAPSQCQPDRSCLPR